MSGPNVDRAWDDADLLVRLLFSQADGYEHGVERECFVCRLQSIINNYVKQGAPSDAGLWLVSFMEKADQRDDSPWRKPAKQAP